MEERFAIRSVLLVIVALLAAFCKPTEQRPRCPSPGQCVENALALEGSRSRSSKSMYLPAVEDPTAVKQLLETLLMQHNENADANGFGTEDDENSTERPSTENSFVDVVHQWGLVDAENATNNIEATARPAAASSFADIVDDGQNTSSISEYTATTKVVDGSSTELPPPAESSSMDIVRLDEDNELKETANENTTSIKDIDDDQSLLEITTVLPQQVASPLDTNEFHFETTTIQPERIHERIQLGNLIGQIDVTTETHVDSTKKKNISPYVVNIPPTKANKKQTKRTTTKGPHVILHPQPLETFTKIPATQSGNQEKFKRKPTTKPDDKLNSLMPGDQKQDIRGEVQFETLNRPISTRKPSATTATPVGWKANATTSRPYKKPINIIQETVVKRGQKPVAGSRIRNPTQSPVVAPPREPDDYLISALASIADVEQNDGDDDGDNEEEDEDGDEGDDEEDESGEEEEEDEEDGDEEEEDDDDDNIFPINSAEENEERENFDYIDSKDASDVLSSVMEEVGAFI